jgi:phosphoribosylanthranilate isomerase
VKICGLRRHEDALAADESGAAYLGVVLSPGFGRSVDPDAAAALLAGVGATPVAVLVDEPPQAAAALGLRVGAGVLQLHGREAVDAVRELGRLGSWRLWKSVRAATLDDVRRTVDAYGPWVHGILVEGRVEGVVGGGGAALDPATFGGLRDAVPPSHQLILAGGLTADTVAAAVARWEPDVVDVSSGVEVDYGRKDNDLVRRFILATRGGAVPRIPEPPDDRGASH